MKIYSRILRYVRNYRKYLGISALLSVLFSVFSGLSIYLTIPLLRTLFFDETPNLIPASDDNFLKQSMRQFETFILSDGKENALMIVCILILVAYSLKNVTGFFQAYFMQKVEKGVVRDVRVAVYEKVNSLSLRYFTTERSGNLISRMTNDVNTIQTGISATFLNLVREPLLIIIFLVLAISISWSMTLIAMVVFPVTVLIIAKIGSSLRRRSMRMQRKASDLLSIITESIYGAKVIRAFNADKFLNKLFKRESDEMYKLTLKSVRASEMSTPISEFLTIIAGVSIIWFGGREILINESLQPEEFLGFLFIIFQLVVPIKNLTGVNNRIQEASASAERLFEILDHPIEVKDDKHGVELNDFNEAIEIKNVNFEYDKSKPVLRNINLQINKSELIAIVGPSGSGKSTLADLIARFYDVSSGEILIDGKNIRSILISSMRKLIGIVQQETILFNDTIRNNIIFGEENISDEKLIEVCKSANAYEFILETKDGFDTVIGERGIKLSGGQRQRISIARTLLRNPQILILDEATSSLDNESEKIVQNALDKLMHNRTSIVIAHRLSTIKNADKIVILNEGMIEGIGTHDELLKSSNNIYKKLYELQFN